MSARFALPSTGGALSSATGAESLDEAGARAVFAAFGLILMENLTISGKLLFFNDRTRGSTESFADLAHNSIMYPLSAMGLTMSFNASDSRMISTKGEKSRPPIGGRVRLMGISNGSVNESSNRVRG